MGKNKNEIKERKAAISIELSPCFTTVDAMSSCHHSIFATMDQALLLSLDFGKHLSL